MKGIMFILLLSFVFTNANAKVKTKNINIVVESFQLISLEDFEAFKRKKGNVNIRGLLQSVFIGLYLR
jgi:hypothetical protein